MNASQSATYVSYMPFTPFTRVRNPFIMETFSTDLPTERERQADHAQRRLQASGASGTHTGQ